MNRSDSIINLIEKVLKVKHDPEAINDEQSVNSAHEELSKEANKHLANDDTTSPMAHAMTKYTNEGDHEEMNAHLRHGAAATDSHKKSITHLKRLTNNKTEHSFHVYRGMGKVYSDKIKKSGMVFKDKGFTSTSLGTRTASAFKNFNADPKKGEGHHFMIHIKPGTKGYYAGGHDIGSGREHEFILHPGTTFRTGGTYEHPNGQTYVKLHIHHQED